MTTESHRLKASQNLAKLDRDIQTAAQSLVRFGVEGAENPNYKIFVVGRELVLAVHLDKYPNGKKEASRGAQLRAIQTKSILLTLFSHQ